MLTLDDMVQIVKPHNEKIVAEQRVKDLERQVAELRGKIFDIKAALGCCVAIMKSDAEGSEISATRRDVIETGWLRSRHEY